MCYLVSSKVGLGFRGVSLVDRYQSVLSGQANGAVGRPKMGAAGWGDFEPLAPICRIMKNLLAPKSRPSFLDIIRPHKSGAL